MISLGLQALITTTYLAAQGDTLRLVCHRHYGESSTNILQMVVDANPFVVTKLILGAGDILVLPPAPKPVSVAARYIKLWDSLAFVQAAITLPKRKEPTRVPKEKLLAELEAFRRRKIVPVPDEEQPGPRPPAPYTGLTPAPWVELDDPYSLVNDALANLQ